jgi:limonene-1,2-epoxide hydrolase
LSANAEVVRRFIDAFNAGDIDAFANTLDPEVEIHSIRGLGRGIGQARKWATRAPGGVQQTIEIEELRADADQVLALIIRRWRWAEDGEPAGADEMAWLFTLRDARVLRWQPFDSRALGVSAAGGEG